MQASVSEWNNLLCYRQTRLLRSKKSLFFQSLFTPTYFAVAAFHSEFKPTQTFTLMHEKFSPPEVIWFWNKGYNKK